jgi:hypothetical protein
MGKFGFGTELDYFNFEHDPKSAGFGDHSDLWSAGLWLTYDVTEKVGLALRAEYLDDTDGFGMNGLALAGRAGSAIASPDADGEVASVAFTVNWKPVPNIKIQPEIRYDHTSYKDGYDGVEDRLTIGAGISYLF